MPHSERLLLTLILLAVWAASGPLEAVSSRPVTNDGGSESTREVVAANRVMTPGAIASQETRNSARGRRRRVYHNNAFDRISLELPQGWTLFHRRERDGERSTAFDFMDPSRLLSGKPGEVRYDLIVSVRTVHPAVQRTQEQHAISWLSRIRQAFLLGPMEIAKTGQSGFRTIDGRKHYVRRYWHEWPRSQQHQDGIFLLYFPDDFDERDRYYVFQWFVSRADDAPDMDLDLNEFDAVVASFRIQPIR